MADKQEDRRIQRTRSMLHEALLDLIVEKGYAAITVQDLIDRANIGRSTFYSHYIDKEDLLLDNINQLRSFLVDQIDKIVKVEGNTTFRLGFGLALLQHVQSHKQMYRATVGKESGAIVLHHMQRMIADVAKKEMEDAGLTLRGAPIIPQEVAVEFTVNTLMTLVSWWMKGDTHTRHSAADVDRIFHQLILAGISNNSEQGSMVSVEKNSHP